MRTILTLPKKQPLAAALTVAGALAGIEATRGAAFDTPCVGRMARSGRKERSSLRAA
jgi:hypothetical protein